MKDLSIGMRVRTAPTALDGCGSPGSRWAGRPGFIVGFPGTGCVRIAFDDGESVTCGPHDAIQEPEVALTEEGQGRLAQLIAAERAREERSVWSQPVASPW